MKKKSKTGTRFDVVYASGRQDSFFAKNSKHYEECLKDLARSRDAGAVLSYREISKQAQKEVAHA